MATPIHHHPTSSSKRTTHLNLPSPAQPLKTTPTTTTLTPITNPAPGPTSVPASFPPPAPPTTDPDPDLDPDPEPVPPPPISIHAGDRPTLLPRTLQMHVDFYCTQLHVWPPQAFETALAAKLGDLRGRLDRSANGVWAAVEGSTTGMGMTTEGAVVEEGGRIVGMVWFDGEYGGGDADGKGDGDGADGDVVAAKGAARLRAFIVDEEARGRGVGKALFPAAMRLTAARRMYEREGFAEAGETWFEGFGKGVLELRYVWRRPDVARAEGDEQMG